MGKVNRRGFLKIGIAGAASLALGTGLTEIATAQLREGGESISRTTGRARQVVPSTCQLCPARCGILGFVEDGWLVKIEGNPKHPNSRGKICAKGQAGVNLLYDPDRLQRPMKRVGARGGGKWQEISWQEALDEVASRLRELREQSHPERFLFQAGTMANPLFVTRFLDAYGTPHVFTAFPHGHYNKTAAQRLTLGMVNQVNDAAHSKYILNFGSNPYEAHLFHIPLVQRIVEGKINNGAKLVTFDVRLSNTAGKSDEWFPLNPGTDAIVALAMANIIMQEGLHDESFLSTWTNYPVAELARYLSQYAPERAEEVSGVRAADIRRIALEYATSRPATVISGTGNSMHPNGTQNERCLLLLSAICGNVDVRGGDCLARTHPFEEPDPVPPKPTSRNNLGYPYAFPFNSQTPSHSVIKGIKEGKRRVGVYMTYMHNPIYSNPESDLNAQVLKNEELIPFFVAVDTYLSESTALADIVLPDTTYLERWDLESGPTFDMVPFVTLRQPVVKPLGESVPFHDICLNLAQWIGGGMEDYFKFRGAESYLKGIVAKIESLQEVGGLNYLKQHGVWYDEQAKPNYRLYEREGFKTPSGKLEVYSQALEEKGFSPLPSFEPPQNGLRDDELVLTSFKPNVLTSSSANSKWLSEIVQDNGMWINKETAERLGIETGDEVRIASAAGSAIATARLTHGLHPKVVAVSDGSGHWKLGRVAQAKRFKSSDPDTQLIWWYRRGNGTSPNAAMLMNPDPIAGGQDWHGTVVKVSKV